MRYKALLAVAILLIGVSLYSQTVSPVTIETLDTTPTVVRTGQVFVQGYRIRYLDLSKYGEKVIIYEDKIKTGFLTLPDEIEIVEFRAFLSSLMYFWVDLVGSCVDLDSMIPSLLWKMNY